MEATPATRKALHDTARKLASLLKDAKQRVVFAESCTAGLVTATLASVPGISEHLCGSAVTYRNDTKHRWIDVSADALNDPGPVSEIVAKQMASGVLAATPEADFALSITGHLGPGAGTLDGIVCIGSARRDGTPTSHKFKLQTPTVASESLRIERQYVAATLVLQDAHQSLSAAIKR